MKRHWPQVVSLRFGDINGDGIDDLIVSAFYAARDGNDYVGETYVVFGKNTASKGNFPSDLQLSSLDANTGMVLKGIDANDYSGYSVSSVDINNDGIEDVIIGATEADPDGKNGAGETYIVFGVQGPTPVPPITNPTDLSSLDGADGLIINGVNDYDGLGTSVSIVGDVNNDGFDDFAVGAPGVNAKTGRAYVIFGTDQGYPVPFDVTTLNGSNGFNLDGDALDRAGNSISAAGDINGDNIDDFIIGASRAGTANGAESGEVYVVFGIDDGVGSFDQSIDLSALDGNDGFIIPGLTAGDGLGNSISAIGDFNDDTYDDILIGASEANSYAGKSYVVFGKNTAFTSPFDLSAVDGSVLTLNGIDAGDYSGGTVSGGGDFNDDGIPDILIGAKDASPGGRFKAGESYVIFGSDAGFSTSINLSSLDGQNGFVINGAVGGVNPPMGDKTPGDGSGFVSNAGDINGDGIDDILIGAPYADPNGNTDGGKGFVVFGKNTAPGDPDAFELSTLDGLNGFVISGIDVENSAGVDVSSAGDFNGDGIGDILIGSYETTAGETYLLFGKDTSTDGLFDANFDLSDIDGINGITINGTIGGDDDPGFLSGGGDINNDGFDDIIIGNGNANNEAGQAFVVFGTDQVSSGDPTPEFTSANTSSFDENGTGNVLDVNANDGDGGAADDGITYTFNGGDDDGDFDINTDTGILTFQSVPDFENPVDSDMDNEYVVEVTANNGSLSSNQTITITVDNINDQDPVFTSNNTSSYEENSTADVLDINANDGDSGASDDDITYTLSGGADQDDFNIDSNSGLLTFKNAPDFENPTDADTNNSYIVQVTANDGMFTSDQTITITVTGIDDEDPIFTSVNSASFQENGTNDVLDVNANNGDGGASDTGITYMLSGGTDQGDFDIDGSSGVLTFKSAPDLENPTDSDMDNEYVIEVTANGGLATSDQTITITVTNQDEDPIFTSPNTASFAENGNGDVLDVNANDGDGGVVDTGITYTITGGLDQDDFNIDANSGVLTFKGIADFDNPSDSDTDNDYIVQVTANDGALTTDQTITISVTDIAGDPMFTSVNTASFEENGTGDILDINANDGDGGADDDGISYDIIGGTDQDKFSINVSTGILTFVDVPDFENPDDSNTDNEYQIEVTANDGGLTASQIVTITVTNEDEDPVFVSSETTAVAENSTGTVLDVNANDGDGGANDANLTYGISGIDQAQLQVDGTTGIITFQNAPDFENPMDDGSNNTYIINITANDGTNSTNQTVTITVTDVSENTAPTMVDQTFNVDENSLDGTIVGTIVATDSDGDDLTFSSEITASSTHPLSLSSAGVLSVKESSLLDFETTTLWAFAATADDGNGGTTQAAIFVNVNDIDENGQVTGLDDLFEENKLTVFPNPSTDKVSISFSLLKSQHVDIDLFTLDGKAVKTLYQGVINGDFSQQFDVSKLETGIYLVQVKYDNEMITFRLIKE